MWKYKTLQDIGNRHEQEDSLWVGELAGGLLAIVCDGMGGHAKGAEAAKAAQEAFIAAIAAGAPPKAALEEANSAVWDLMSAYSRPGTTLTALFLHDDGSWFCHIGDSSLWEAIGLQWVQMTDRHGNGNILTSCLGYHRSVARQVEAIGMGREDLCWVDPDAFLLVTDGILVEWLKRPPPKPCERNTLKPPPAPADGEDWGAYLQRALKVARDGGSTDNATAIVVWRDFMKLTEEEKGDAISTHFS